MRLSAPSLTRCLAVWLAATAGAVLAGLVLAPDAVLLAGGPGPDLEQALVRLSAAVALGCAAWGWLATTAVAVQAARGRAAGRVPGVPAWLRRAVLLGCGVALAGGVTTPALADPGSLAGLPLPDRATGSVHAPSASGPSGPTAAPAAVVVRPGDTLWDLAAADLGHRVSPAEVDRHWRRLHRLNRSVVGPDPDLIRPGQQLRLPAPPEENRR
ncbi:LysM peptidoglycan-binding domain-containing protein [Nocardioides dongkuii]|uniref:LysM peptidoglycan-binding domain-containing protein n=1 Tax=Nocardioides dongkuii TaxID=2760089 RepID=UPI0015F89ACB|nr:LysM peptidoglycan-binding domain-containing protein [Nocardioides dongkuii]